MAVMADADRVLITHEDLTDDTPPASVTRRAYERAWKGLGWTLVTEDLSKLKKEELVEAARAAGVDTSGNKEDLIARIQSQES